MVGGGGLSLHISVHTCFIEFYVQSFCNKQLVETSEMWGFFKCVTVTGENKRLCLKLLQVWEEEEEEEE